MKITLDLPAWVDKRNIRVFAGIELVARRYKGRQWEIKTARCSRCGRCCSNLPPHHPFPTIDGQCVHLLQEPGNANPTWSCQLGFNRPFGCSASAPHNLPECTIQFQTVTQITGADSED